MIRHRMVLLFIAPATFLYLGLMIWPALQAFQLSFYATSGFGDTPVWVGFGNYIRLWHDATFWKSTLNMLIILFVGGFAIFFLAFLFTMLLNSGLRGKKHFRALIFMPNMIAVVAITTFWSFVFTPRFGLLTGLLKALGLNEMAATAWTAPENVLMAMLVGLVWTSAGFFTILILSGADKIPQDMFEAARLEGASNFQIFRYVTLPMMWDIVTIAVVLWAIQAVKMTEFPFAFGGPNIDQNLYTPAIYLYIMGFGQREPVYALGYAAAIGVALFIFTLIIVVGLRLLMKREQLEY